MTPEEIDADRRRHLDRAPHRAGGRNRNISLEPAGDGHCPGPGKPVQWFTRIWATTDGAPPVAGMLDDFGLLMLADLIYRYLDRPPPAVRIDFKTIARHAPRRRRKR